MEWLALPGLLVEGALEGVAGLGAAHLFEDVFEAGAAEVGEGYAVALLQVAEVGCGGDVLEGAAFGVAEEAVREEGLVGGVAGAEIDVEPAVVVEVAEVGAHGEDGAVEVGCGGDVGEGAVVVVAVEPGEFGVDLAA